MEGKRKQTRKYVSFSSHFHLSFSSLHFCFFFCCSHPCCPLLMNSHFVFVTIVATCPSSELSFSYILFFVFLSLCFLFSPSVYLLFQHDTPAPQKKTTQNSNFVLTGKTGPALANFTNPIFYGKIKLYVAERKQNVGKSSSSRFQNNNFMSIETQNFRGHRSNTSRKDAPGPQTPIFIVFCDFHLNIKTQLLEKISSRGVKTGRFFRPPNLHVEEHHHHNPHISRHRRVHLEQAQDLPNTYFYSAKLTWLVG